MNKLTKRERAAVSLERKIERAIERGEFTPDYGYLSEIAYPRHGLAYPVLIGPCGCAMAAAATVNGFDVDVHGPTQQEELVAYLETVGMSREDSLALENGYEDNFMANQLQALKNPYYKLGRRLRRFHHGYDDRVET